MAERTDTGMDVARTITELVDRYGVPEDKLAEALGWKPEELTARRTGPAPAPAAPVVERPGRIDAVIRWLAGGYLLALLSAVVYYKSAFIQMLTVSPLLSTYGLVVVFYISSRFLFSAFYRPGGDHGIEPHVAIVMPGFNEEDAIARSLRSLLELEYPADKLEIVAVNDGSTDATLREMRRVAATANGRAFRAERRRQRGAALGDREGHSVTGGGTR